jgi:PAS domain S-box-containing protein
LQSLSAISQTDGGARFSTAFSDPERDRYIQQLQILDQIHESVITMDLAGFILSWNAGAERLFGYTAEEAIGQNVIFLYENEEDDPQSDYFLTHGGRTMEVRQAQKWRSVLGQSDAVHPEKRSRAAGGNGGLSDRYQRPQAI